MKCKACKKELKRLVCWNFFLVVCSNLTAMFLIQSFHFEEFCGRFLICILGLKLLAVWHHTASRTEFLYCFHI